MWAFPEGTSQEGAGGGLVKTEGFGPGKGGTIIYFSCEDFLVEEARVIEAGGTIVTPRVSIGEYGFMSLIGDTEGNVIGFHSNK